MSTPSPIAAALIDAVIADPEALEQLAAALAPRITPSPVDTARTRVGAVTSRNQIGEEQQR